ncbi:MAG: GIY-YIG nuclease family protein [Crocinitomicaceae bacterium]|nr:GIY-YIG nuclease family protein [Crocinitomicaceae bacterium]MBK8927386.1 GIY-YIG nuclease family protein [Crocinitomicaceae bacterium]
MYSVYILYSKKLGKHYIGLTSDTIEQRIEKHNTKHHGNHRFTAATNDWELFFQIACESLSQARKIELHIKSMKSKVYLQNLTKYPEMTEKLLMKFNKST